MGQNFLVDANVADAIVLACALKPGEQVLEIGPGFGVLTERLLSLGMDVTAVEKDSRLCRVLRLRWSDPDGFHLIEGDALLQDWPRLLPGFHCVVSNLPYSVGTRLVMQFCREAFLPHRWVLMVQCQVADRFAASEGAPERGLASVWVQRRFEVRRIRRVSPTCFWPRPEVSSGVIQLCLHDRFPLDPLAETAFYALTRQGFMHRRKQLLACWRRMPSPIGGVPDRELESRFRDASVSPDMRPETLNIGQWCALAGVWAREMPVPHAWNRLANGTKGE